MRHALARGFTATALLLAGCATNSPSATPAAQQTDVAKKTITLAQPATAAARGTDPDELQIYQAVMLAKSGKAQEVLDGPINQLIARFEAAYPGAAGITVFCAKTQADTLMYLVSGAAHPPVDKHGKQQNVVVLGPAWAQAYWVRGYSYGELKRYDLEVIELQKALKLSPRDSQYLNELAFVYQGQGQWQRSLDTYKLAEGYASLSSQTVAENTCTSFRGEGYVLVEMSRLDEAEAAYHACLQLTPGEPRSLAELDYIRKLRAKLK
jgi:tetratricopeptide (TPR) repeat protein